MISLTKPIFQEAYVVRLPKSTPGGGYFALSTEFTGSGVALRSAKLLNAVAARVYANAHKGTVVKVYTDRAY